MSDMKPEPMIDKQGVQWCDSDCAGMVAWNDYSSNKRIYRCQISDIVWECPEPMVCIPAVREMAAELERKTKQIERIRGYLADLRRHLKVLDEEVIIRMGPSIAAIIGHVSNEAAKGGECDERTSEVG